MNIQTKFLGEVEIDLSEIITFENGLPGFPEYTKYILLGLDANLPIALLQSTEDEQIGFVVGYPFAFKSDYAFDLSEEDKEQLQLMEESEVATYTVVTLKKNFTDSTINLLAPIIINTKQKLGKQIVLQDSEKYPLRYQIAISSKGSEK
ncbi:flagellar assembly protein FliW [Solibacillus sp. FSL W7-1324]|uniref:flagellar assembly protein FliW n=1 Tax=Solibacillus sp. FSL W7-1324 TaxID=2921701 RepID=UPI0030FAC715